MKVYYVEMCTTIADRFRENYFDVVDIFYLFDYELHTITEDVMRMTNNPDQDCEDSPSLTNAVESYTSIGHFLATMGTDKTKVVMTEIDFT